MNEEQLVVTSESPEVETTVEPMANGEHETLGGARSSTLIISDPRLIEATPDEKKVPQS